MTYWQDKVVLVTGGSSGLGRVIAEAFAAAGAKVVIAALEADAVETAAAEMRRQGREVAHADDGFLYAEDLVEPAQVDHPWM